MARESIFNILGLPTGFGEAILVFAFILALAPYLSGADFGIFKVPQLSAPRRKRLRLLGPPVLACVVFLFLPIWRKADEELSLRGGSPISLPSGKDPREDLRERHKVRGLREQEDELALSSLPNGIFGFDIPWADPSRDRTLSRNPGGTAVLEVHKLLNGTVMLVGFVSNDGASKLRDAKGVVEVQLFPSAWEEAVTLVGIPVQRILEYNHRSFRDVIDLKLAWPDSTGKVARSGSASGGRQEPPKTTALEIEAEPVNIDFRTKNPRQTGGCHCGNGDITFPGDLRGKVGEPLTFRYDGSEVCHGQSFRNFEGAISWTGTLSTPMANRNDNPTFPGIAGTLRVTFSQAAAYNVRATFSLDCVDINCSQRCSGQGNTTLVIR